MKNRMYKILFFTIILGFSGCKSLSIQAPDKKATNYENHYEELGSHITEKNTLESQGFIWPTVIDDPQLAEAIKKVLDSNYDVKRLVSNIRRSQSILDQQKSFLIPTDSLTASIDYQAYGEEVVGFQENSERLLLTYQLSWPLDFWGQIRDRIKSAREDVSFSREELHSTKIILVGQIQKRWIQIIELEMLIKLNKETLKVFSDNLKTIQGRYQSGLAQAIDYELLKANVATSKANILSQKSTRDQFKRSINVLMGNYPSKNISGVTSFKTKEIKELPKVNPLLLIEQRPDIKRVVSQINSLGYNYKAIRKKLYPVFNLNASLNWNSNDISTWLKSESLSSQFNFGISQIGIFRNKEIAEIESNRHLIQAAIENYHLKVLQVFEEVENLYSQASYLEEQEKELKLAAESAKKAEDLSWEKYHKGLTDILSVLTAQRRSFENKRQWIIVLSKQIQNKIDLYLATGAGGVWQMTKE